MIYTIPCLDPNGNPDKLSIDDVCYISLYKKKIILFHTLHGTYTFRFEGTLEACEDVYKELGFERLDSGVIVNMAKIIEYDPDIKIVYFDADKKVRANVSRTHQHKLKNQNR